MIAFVGIGVLIVAASFLVSHLLHRRFPHLMTAALLIIAVGLAHSIMGELALISPLKLVKDLPTPRGSVEQTWLVIRVTWHAPTLFWFGLASVLIWMEMHPVSASHPFLWMVVAVFSIASFVSVLTSPLGHVAWLYFLVIALLCLVRITLLRRQQAKVGTGVVSHPEI